MTLRTFRIPARALVIVASLFSPAAASADFVFTVDSTLDKIDVDTSDGECRTDADTCTLRAAVMQANVIGGVGVTIQLPAGTYLLTRPASTADSPPGDGDLNFTTPVSGNPLIQLLGSGESTAIIDANGLDRVLTVGTLRHARIVDVTLRNGFVDSLPGGGIQNRGTLELIHCTVSGNTAFGFFGDGGGISSVGSGVLYLADTTVSGNVAGDEGGGIYSTSLLSLNRTTVDGNSADAGGGIHTKGGIGVWTSTISRNSAVSGGGIYRMGLGGQGDFVDTTVAENVASSVGGGLLDISNTTRFYNSTIFGNQAHAGGGGIYVGNAAVVSLNNSLVAGNLADGGGYDDCLGLIYAFGGNRFSTAPANCQIVNLGGDGWLFLNGLEYLGQLDENGGPTETVALLPGSNAINAGDSTFGCTGTLGEELSQDQRGVPRTLFGRCDVGAYEEGFLFFDSFESGDTSAW